MKSITWPGFCLCSLQAFLVKIGHSESFLGHSQSPFAEEKINNTAKNKTPIIVLVTLLLNITK